ncbi:MAG: HlyD family efflux transporter periplasmic adaptor subunit [Pseudomonadota bacterium]
MKQIRNDLTKWARRLSVLLPVLLGGAMIWQAMAFKPAPPLVEPNERRVPVSYVVATPRSFMPTVSGFGTVSPARVWTAVTQVPGRIAYLNPAFVRGGSVAQGDVLVRIADADARITLSSANADLKSAEARLDEMRVSEQTTAGALKIEQDSLDLAEADLARSRQLVKRGVVSDSVVQAEQREVLAQRSKVQSLESSLALLPAQIRAQEQAVAKADLAKQSAALDLQRTVLTAPFDARVASVDIEVSQYVGTGAVLGVLDGSADAEVEVQISQSRLLALARLESALRLHGEDAARHSATIRSASLKHDQVPSATRFAPGDPRRLTARVSLSSDQGAISWNAEVDRTSDAASAETRSVGVIVRVPDPQRTDGGTPPLMKGAFVKVDLSAPTVAGAIMVPQSSIRNGRVMIAGPDNRLDFRPVAQVFTFDSIAVLAPGALPIGARIITSEPSPAIEGLLLSPQPDVMAEARLTAAADGGAL